MKGQTLQQYNENHKKKAYEKMEDEIGCDTEDELKKIK